jgi:DNA-binding CsgD family transcriptional regulator
MSRVGTRVVVPETDVLAVVLDAYRAALHEQDLAETHRGHVSAPVRERLRELRGELRDSLSERAGLPNAEVARRLRLLAEVDARLHSIAEQDAESRLSELVGIHESLVRMRELDSPQQLIEAAPGELCRACGFTRAMISIVRGSVWVPQVLEVVEGADPDADARREYLGVTRIQLAHMLLETEMVRRRIPVLMNDPGDDPRAYPPIVEAMQSTSYVAAPIVPTERTIGFFHADRYGQELPVSVQDRDNLWVFAEHFGLLYERVVLVERMERQRTELRQVLSGVAEALDDLCAADIELARAEEVAESAQVPWVRETRSRIESLLTAREREVLELMADGSTNAQIAEVLIVSEGTVKSHVKRILRKLHVSNRAEAVARYLHLIARERRMARMP